MKILSMSGFVPEQICDTVRFFNYNGERNISHYCGYASDYISRVLHDPEIDGAVYPKSCDSSRIITSYLSNTDKYTHQINIPSFSVIGAVEHFASEIKRYKESVEKYYGASIDDIEERIEKINQRNSLLRKLYDSIDSIQYSDYLDSIHNMLEKPLKDQIVSDIKSNDSHGKRIYIIGSLLPDIEIIKLIDSVGLNVVGDNLPESGRLVSNPEVVIKTDYYTAIADNILSQRQSPTQNGLKGVLAKDLEEIKSKEVKGVVFITQQYCEPYDYYYSIAKGCYEEEGIEVLQITLSGTQDSGKVKLAIEAFADKL